MSDEPLGVSDFEAFRAYISGDAWLRQAALLEDTPWRSGAPRKFHPHVLLLFWIGTTAVWKSVRRTACQFADPDIWATLRRLVCERFPRDPELWLPERPPERHHYLYFRDNHLEPQLAAVLELHEHEAPAQARIAGLCDPDGPGSFNHPDPTRTLTADAKVVTPLFRAQHPTKVDKRTGEIRPVRHDPDARLHITGDRREAFGNKLEVLHVRGPDRHQRVILSVDLVRKSEGATLVAMLDRVAPALPGAQAIVYDGGIRGTHINHILVNNRIVPIVPPQGSRAAKPPAPRLLPEDRAEPLFTQLGAPGIGHLTEDGSVAFERLTRRSLYPRPNADDTWRWYADYEQPDGTSIRVRVDQTAKDKLRGYNRAENLRPITKGDDDYHSLMGLRSDSESLNRYYEDSLFNNRAHSVGKERQLLDYLGFATAVNAVAVYRARAKAPPGEATAS